MTGLTSHWWMIILVLVVVLIIWGPGKLPDVGAGMGRAIREFRKASSETRDALNVSTAPTPAPTEPSPASAPAPVSPAQSEQPTASG